jgi:hypothetical protein
MDRGSRNWCADWRLMDVSRITRATTLQRQPTDLRTIIESAIETAHLWPPPA